MKIAKIIPIFTNYEFTNYRPISILSQFSKILEKLFNLRLETFLDANKILSDMVCPRSMQLLNLSNK